MRIAVYVRKSKWTGRGESIGNQILMCREYIEKYIEGAEGAEILVYTDEGFSGKDTNRPQFQKMLAEMKRRPFQYLVCYRLDRLGRNLADLARLIEKLNRDHTEFVSIKERFDTSTPMGKAMVYFSGVLAQMEREQIGERVRDNMLLLARSGRWLGGNTPLGFHVREKLCGEKKIRRAFYLEAEEGEEEIPRQIFREFLSTHSFVRTAERLEEKKIFSRTGRPFSPENIGEILENPVYCQSGVQAYDYFQSLGCILGFSREEAREDRGLLRYGRTVSSRYRGQAAGPETWIIAQGEHKGLISQEDFLKVQRILEKRRKGKRGEGRIQNQISLQNGLLFCACGSKMRPKYYGRGQTDPTGQRKFSYRCPCRDKTRGQSCQGRPLPGNLSDALVWEYVMERTKEAVSAKEIFEELFRQIQREPEEEDQRQRETEQLQEEARRLTQRLAETEDRELAEFLKKEIRARLEQRDQIRKERDREEKHPDKAGREELLLRYRDPGYWESFLQIPDKREYLGLFVEKILWEEGVLKIRFFVSPGPQ